MSKVTKDSTREAPAQSAPRPEVAEFLERVRGLGPAATAGKRGRLIFALDATMSRQPTWDTACALQADMFREAADVGGLDIQLVYFRGHDECRASGWVAGSEKLAKLMGSIDCRGGQTQIGRVLTHARKEYGRQPVQALVFVGDAMEEQIDDLCAVAGELGLLGVRAFMFQEGHNPAAEAAYREIARLTHGAYGRFDSGTAHELGELLRAVAAYAAGGLEALQALSSRQAGRARKLLAQLR